MDMLDYIVADAWTKVLESAKDVCTPFLAIDLDVVEAKYQQLTKGFDQAAVYYAIKANPLDEIIESLADLGSCFDVASVYELEKLKRLNIPAERISCGNTIKKCSDIKAFYDYGVRLYATDAESDLRNIAEFAPGSKVYIRVLTEGSEGADWPLSRKFGCNPEMATELAILARDLGLIPYGISFHVGSQQRDIDVWDSAIAKVKVIFDRLLAEKGIKLKMINMGGGFPANYLQKTNTIETYVTEIKRFLRESFGGDLPEIILEPGRSIVGEAGIIVSEVVLISRKSATAQERWVYTDVGLFNGLIETLGESIIYPLATSRDGDGSETGEVVLAGPTCDGIDILYEKKRFELPLSLEIGDRIFWFSTGAYTASYSSVEFNGFPPLKTLVLPRR
jgi:ornithine decarboxylase